MNLNFMLENLITNSMYDVFKNSSFESFTYVSKVISIALALVVMVYAYRCYKIIHSSILLGIILSFGFMAITDVFVISILLIIDNASLFNLFFWLRLCTMSFAFTFLALAYYTSANHVRKSSTVALKFITMSTIPIFFMLLSTWFFNNTIFPIFAEYDDYFRVYNICALGYVFIKSLFHLASNVRRELSYFPLACGILLMGQLFLFAFTLDGSFSAVIAAFLAKDVGLAIFGIMLYDTHTGRASFKGLKPQNGFDR
jgi:hypothetical protein